MIQISGVGVTGVVTPIINPPLVPGTPLTLSGGGQFQFIGNYQLGQFLFTGGYLLLPTDTIPNLALQGGTLALGPGFQGGAITNLAIGGMPLTNTLPVTGNFTAINSQLYGNFTVANGGTFICGSTLNGLLSIASGGLLAVTNSSGTTINPIGALTVVKPCGMDSAEKLCLRLRKVPGRRPHADSILTATPATSWACSSTISPLATTASPLRKWPGKAQLSEAKHSGASVPGWFEWRPMRGLVIFASNPPQSCRAPLSRLWPALRQ